MGLLDDAIREHLDLKRRRGADPAEVEQQEREALGPVGGRAATAAPASDEAPAPPGVPVERAAEDLPPRPAEDREPPPPPDDPGPPTQHHGAVRAPDPDPEPPPPPPPAAATPPPSPAPPPDVSQPTQQYSVEDLDALRHDAPPEDVVPADEEPGAEDVLDETPDFLQEAPEHDRLWFEQRPPRDFDFEHPLTWLDVFTGTSLTGNQLAVVHDADGLSETTMLAFARETKLSETTFVQTADAAGADYRNRIWMVRGEVPFAGHPSLGTAVAVALARGEQEASYVQQTQSGLQRCDVRLTGPTSASASMLQEPAVLGPSSTSRGCSTCSGSTPPGAIRRSRRRSCGPVRRRSSCPWCARRSAAPSRPRRLPGAHRRALGAHVFVAAVDGEAVRARAVFIDFDRIGEDPATGSAVGPLMAYLHERCGLDRLRVEQGVEMGRPSVLDCSVEGDRVRVGGDAVVVLRGTVSL